MKSIGQRGEGSMDIRYLQTFKTIVDEGSFSKAAGKLNYTQSTITFHVGQLEKELHATLFEKVGRRMVLTQAGVNFIPYANEVLEALERMKTFQEDMTECRGELRIGAPESILCFLLPPLLKAYHLEAPKVELDLSSMNSESLMRALEKDDVDIAVFYGHKSTVDGARIRAETYGTFPLKLCASPQVKKGCPVIENGGDYPDLCPIIQPPNGGVRHQFNHFLRDHDLSFGRPILIQSTQTIINLVRNDVGICYLPDFAVEESLEKGELVELMPEDRSGEISVCYGTRVKKWQSPAMKAFLRMLEKERAGGRVEE